MKPLEEHPERRGSAAQAPAGRGWRLGVPGQPLPPPNSPGAAHLPGMRILGGHPGADPPAGPRQSRCRCRSGPSPPSRWGWGPLVPPPSAPHGALAGTAPAHALADTQRQRGMVLDEHSRSLGGSSIPPAKLKPKPAPSPAPSPLKKNPWSRFFFFLIPSENCSSNLTPAEPPLGGAAASSGEDPQL